MLTKKQTKELKEYEKNLNKSLKYSKDDIAMMVEDKRCELEYKNTLWE